MGINSILVLIVEDEPMIQQLLKHELEDAGFIVTAIESGAEAIKKLDEDGKKYRALLTDINLQDKIRDGMWHGMPVKLTRTFP